MELWVIVLRPLGSITRGDCHGKEIFHKTGRFLGNSGCFHKKPLSPPSAWPSHGVSDTCCLVTRGDRGFQCPCCSACNGMDLQAQVFWSEVQNVTLKRNPQKKRIWEGRCACQVKLIHSSWKNKGHDVLPAISGPQHSPSTELVSLYTAKIRVWRTGKEIQRELQQPLDNSSWTSFQLGNCLLCFQG